MRISFFSAKRDLSDQTHLVDCEGIPPTIGSSLYFRKTLLASSTHYEVIQVDYSAMAFPYESNYRAEVYVVER